MIYDEGFEVKMGNLELFFFNKYYKNANNQYLSDCSKTLIGWVYMKFDGKNYRSCAYGEKAGESKINMATEKLIVVNNRVEKVNQSFLQTSSSFMTNNKF